MDVIEECGISPELREPRERTDKGVLRELPGFLRIATESIGERVHSGRVHVVQRTPGQPIPRDDLGDELCFVHAAVLSTADLCRDHFATRFDTDIGWIVR